MNQWINSVSIYLFSYLSIYPSIHPSIHPSIYPSIHLSILINQALFMISLFSSLFLSVLSFLPPPPMGRACLQRSWWRSGHDSWPSRWLEGARDTPCQVKLFWSVCIREPCKTECPQECSLKNGCNIFGEMVDYWITQDFFVGILEIWESTVKAPFCWSELQPTMPNWYVIVFVVAQIKDFGAREQNNFETHQKIDVHRCFLLFDAQQKNFVWSQYYTYDTLRTFNRIIFANI